MQRIKELLALKKHTKEEIQINVEEIINGKDFKDATDISLLFLEFSNIANSQIIKDPNLTIIISFSRIKNIHTASLLSFVSQISLKYPEIKINQKYFITGIKSEKIIELTEQIAFINNESSTPFNSQIIEVKNNIKDVKTFENTIKRIKFIITIVSSIVLFYGITNIKQMIEISYKTETTNLLSKVTEEWIIKNKLKKPIKYKELINAIITNSKKYNIDPFFIPAVITAESHFVKTAMSRRPDGTPIALGYMQIYFSVWGIPVTDTNMQELFEEEFNIKMGTYIFNHYYNNNSCNIYRTMLRYNGGNISGLNSKYVTALAESHIYTEKIINYYYEINKIKNKELEKINKLAKLTINPIKRIGYLFGIYKP